MIMALAELACALHGGGSGWQANPATDAVTQQDIVFPCNGLDSNISTQAFGQVLPSNSWNFAEAISSSTPMSVTLLDRRRHFAHSWCEVVRPHVIYAQRETIRVGIAAHMVSLALIPVVPVYLM